ncbi:flagellar biosynthetic protein FliO [Luteimonas sp. 100069]|uniref:flagellar biosynthetic protein FliO n=1 Tax=Luteimonas sp. 100069 TaxID=2006109 RepID=UPI0013157769|nr:flagellar biosynthetic protein FliO [Luteimonas sp. 100069]
MVHARSSRFCFPLAAAAVLAPGLALAGVAPAAAAPTPGDSFIGELLAILIPLVLIIAGLLFLLRLLRRRYGLSGSDAPLSVVQILPVGPRERLVLVKSRGGRVFAIGVGAHSVNFVTDMAPEDLQTPVSSAAAASPELPVNIDGHR